MIRPRRFRRFRRWLSDRLAGHISTGSRAHIWIDKTLNRMERVNIWIWKKMVSRLIELYAGLRDDEADE